MSLITSRVGFKWEPFEDKYLRENYEHGDMKEMARHLGRTEKSLRDRARVLGVKRQIRKAHEQFEKEFYDIHDRGEYRLVSEYTGVHDYLDTYSKIKEFLKKELQA